MAAKTSLLFSLVVLSLLFCNVTSVPLPDKADKTEIISDSAKIISTGLQPTAEPQKPVTNANPEEMKQKRDMNLAMTTLTTLGTKKPDTINRKPEMPATTNRPGQGMSQSETRMGNPGKNEQGPGMKKPGPGLTDSKPDMTKIGRQGPRGAIGIQSISGPNKGDMIIIGFEDGVLFTNTGEKISLKLNATKAKMVMADPNFLNKIRHFAPIMLASSGPISMEPKIVNGKIVIVNNKGVVPANAPPRKKVQVRIGNQMIKLDVEDFEKFMRKMNPRAMEKIKAGLTGILESAEFKPTSFKPHGNNNGMNNGNNNGMNKPMVPHPWGQQNKPNQKPNESKNPLKELMNIAECFPAYATVRTADGRTLRMDQLKENDNIISDVNGATAHIFTFSHRDHTVRSQFYRLCTASGSEIVLSPGHYLPVNAQSRLTAAADVSVGDNLKLADGTFSPVISTDVIWETGLFNPHTVDGSIVVNGVVASTFTSSVKPVVARAMLSPVAAFFRMFGLNILGSFLNGPCSVLRSFVDFVFNSNI